MGLEALFLCNVTNYSRTSERHTYLRSCKWQRSFKSRTGDERMSLIELLWNKHLLQPTQRILIFSTRNCPQIVHYISYKLSGFLKGDVCKILRNLMQSQATCTNVRVTPQNRLQWFASKLKKYHCLDQISLNGLKSMQNERNCELLRMWGISISNLMSEGALHFHLLQSIWLLHTGLDKSW